MEAITSKSLGFTVFTSSSMSHENYAPPKADLEIVLDGADSKQRRMHSLWAVALATSVGGAFAAGYLLYRNFMVMGLHRSAKRTIGWFSVGGLLALYVTWHTPPDVISFMLSVGIPQLTVVMLAAQFMQGEALRDFRQSGGRMRSNFVGFGVGIASNLAIKAFFYVVLNVVE